MHFRRAAARAAEVDLFREEVIRMDLPTAGNADFLLLGLSGQFDFTAACNRGFHLFARQLLHFDAATARQARFAFHQSHGLVQINLATTGRRSLQRLAV